MGLEDLDRIVAEKKRIQRREDRRERRRLRRKRLREIWNRVSERLAFLLGVFVAGFAGLPGRIFVIATLVAIAAFVAWKMGVFG